MSDHVVVGYNTAGIRFYLGYQKRHSVRANAAPLALALRESPLVPCRDHVGAPKLRCVYLGVVRRAGSVR